MPVNTRSRTIGTKPKDDPPTKKPFEKSVAKNATPRTRTVKPTTIIEPVEKKVVKKVSISKKASKALARKELFDTYFRRVTPEGVSRDDEDDPETAEDEGEEDDDDTVLQEEIAFREILGMEEEEEPETLRKFETIEKREKVSRRPQPQLREKAEGKPRRIRPPSFDPNWVPIVNMESCHKRMKLEQGAVQQIEIMSSLKPMPPTQAKDLGRTNVCSTNLSHQPMKRLNPVPGSIVDHHINLSMTDPDRSSNNDDDDDEAPDNDAISPLSNATQQIGSTEEVTSSNEEEEEEHFVHTITTTYDAYESKVGSNVWSVCEQSYI